MTITTKHNVNDIVWVMKNNRPVECRVNKITIEVELSPMQNEMKLIFYHLVAESGKFNESELHATKEALLQSL